MPELSPKSALFHATLTFTGLMFNLAKEHQVPIGTHLQQECSLAVTLPPPLHLPSDWSFPHTQSIKRGGGAGGGGVGL